MGPDVIVMTGVSSTTTQWIESAPVPETFVAETSRVYVPGASPVVDHGDVQADAGAPLRLQVTVASGSDTAKLTVASGAAVDADGPLRIATVGVPTGGAVTVQATEVESVPPAFAALMSNVCVPTASALADHGDEHPLAGAPSRLHVTVASGSDTVNETEANVAVVNGAGPPVTVRTGAGGRTVQL
jgi:hypothetical protein